jgi:hypothetical protein
LTLRSFLPDAAFIVPFHDAALYWLSNEKTRKLLPAGVPTRPPETMMAYDIVSPEDEFVHRSVWGIVLLP